MPIGAPILQEARTRSLTGLPPQESQGLRVLGPCVRHRHQLVFRWLLVRHLISGERAHLHALARPGPAHLAYPHDRRLWCAASGCTKTWLWWCADQAWQALRPAEDGILDRVGDSTVKGQRGPKPPVAQKTRLSPHHPDGFGVRIVLLMAQGDVYRSPVDCAVLRRKDAPDDQTEQALLRQRRHDFRRPVWGQKVIGTADAASASQANMALIPEWGSGEVLARPRT
jgi:hypothetical protein